MGDDVTDLGDVVMVLPEFGAGVKGVEFVEEEGEEALEGVTCLT